MHTRTKVGLNSAIGNTFRNNRDPFTERVLASARTLPTTARIILAYQGFTEPEQIVTSEDEELDLPSGQILGNGGSFELAQALRKADNESM